MMQDSSLNTVERGKKKNKKNKKEMILVGANPSKSYKVLKSDQEGEKQVLLQEEQKEVKEIIRKQEVGIKQEEEEKNISKIHEEAEDKKGGIKTNSEISSHVVVKTQLDRTQSTKTMLSSFAQQIQESIKQYKPPLTKLNIDLNPKELGKIELSITKKGKDLHISVTSNTQAITIFAQNQMDLRLNLQNIGFNNIDFNFSQNNHSSQKDNENKQKRNKNSLREYQEVEEISKIQYDSLEIVLPKYA